MTWDDMTEHERMEAVQNFYAAADFFAQHITHGQPNGSSVEQLTPSRTGGEA